MHVRYDHFSGLFDLHAHLICEVAADVSEDVRVRLMTAFSETDVEDVPIRNLAAVVTYCLWGVYRPAEALTWPDHAIEAVWALHSGDSRPHLVRTGKAFQEWRRNRLASSKNARQSDELRRRRKNRRATRDPRSGTQTGDRLLAKTPIRIRDQEVLALIVEKAPKAPSTSAPRTSSSATVATTQSRPDGPSSGSVVRRKSRPKAKPLHQPPPASGSAPGGDRENVKPKRQKALPTCPEIPSRKQWWFNAWPSAHGGTTRLPGPIKRRLARLLTRSRPPDAG